MSPLAEATVAVLAVVGGAAALVGSVALVRLPSTLMRLHATGKTATLGLAGVLLAALVEAASRGTPSGRELLLPLFVALVSPVAAQRLASAARHRGLRDPDPRGGPGDRSGEPRPPDAVDS
jgi:multicomponent K+:H+ antiporter subunit G